MGRRLGVLLLWLVALAAAASPAPPTKEAKIRPTDVLGVTVVGHEAYSGDFPVVSDGSVSGPGFGRVVAAGRTLEQVQREITASLRRLVRDPEVFVFFRLQVPPAVYVVGVAVNPPGQPPVSPGASIPSGSVALTPETDVRSLLAGVTLGNAPDRLRARLFRGGAPTEEIDLVRLLAGDPETFNGPLEPGDLVLIEPKPQVTVWMAGPFGTPGERRFMEGTTLEQAISQVGGLEIPAPPGAADALSRQAFLAKVRLTVRRGEELLRFPAVPGESTAKFVLETGDTVGAELPEAITVDLAGFVRAAGQIALESGATLLEAVTVAGGVTPGGTLDGVNVFRRGEVFVVDAVPRPGEAPPPFELEDGDLVYVPPTRASVIVLGMVNQPGRYDVPDGFAWRASDALAAARGLAPRGTFRRVILMRPGPDGKLAPTQFNLDEFLKDGRLESNPELKPGDVLLFGQPDGMSVQGIASVVSSALLFETLFRRLD